MEVLSALGDIAVNVAVQGAGNNIYTNGHNIAVVLTGDRNALDGISVTATASTTPGPTGDVTLAGSAAYAGGIDIAGTSVTASIPWSSARRPSPSNITASSTSAAALPSIMVSPCRTAEA